MESTIKIAIVGGGFGTSFYFHLHPNCKVVAVSAISLKDRNMLQEYYGCDVAYSSLEELLKDKNVDAVALFTPVPLHASQSIQCMRNGKHVLCAVPVGLTIEECAEVKKAVNETGLTYMMAETSYYRQDVISARDFYNNNKFGNLISVKSDYHHPGLDLYFYDKQGFPTWRNGLAPMLYATHCTTYLTGVNKERIEKVSCVGWSDNSPMMSNNAYNNPFWNQTALFIGEKNTPFNVNISWKGAIEAYEGGEWLGDSMSLYSENARTKCSNIVYKSSELGHDDAGFPFQSNDLKIYNQPLWWQTDLLPESLRFNSGHFGSHTFLTHEFVDSLLNERQPSIDIQLAIDLTLPGIFAHQSSLRGSEMLKVSHYEDI